MSKYATYCKTFWGMPVTSYAPAPQNPLSELREARGSAAETEQQNLIWNHTLYTEPSNAAACTPTA